MIAYIVNLQSFYSMKNCFKSSKSINSKIPFNGLKIAKLINKEKNRKYQKILHL